jgi:hypothetical protein
MNDATTTIADRATSRQCGRCRLRFPIPADTHPMELRDWWLCPNCVAVLLPGRRRRPTSVELPGGPT